MLTVAILVNGNPVMARSAVNTGRTRGGKTVYSVDDGSEVLHAPGDGAAALAALLLGTIREPRRGGGEAQVADGYDAGPGSGAGDAARYRAVLSGCYARGPDDAGLTMADAFDDLAAELRGKGLSHWEDWLGVWAAEVRSALAGPAPPEPGVARARRESREAAHAHARRHHRCECRCEHCSDNGTAPCPGSCEVCTGEGR